VLLIADFCLVDSWESVLARLALRNLLAILVSICRGLRRRLECPSGGKEGILLAL